MKCKIALPILVSWAFYLGASPSANALTINFATGQNESGTVQGTGGALDANWTLSNGDKAKVVSSSSADWWYDWIANSTTSSWIAPNPDSYTDNGGTYTLTYSFDLTGYDLSTAQFTGGMWSVDNIGTISINGTVISSLTDYNTWTNFQILNSYSLPVSNLITGINMLTITSIGGQYFHEAARLEGMLTISETTPVPEPATAFMFSIGIVSLAGLKKKHNT